MDRKKELIKNTAIIFIGKASTQLLSFLLLPLYTTFLSTADYGTIDLILTYVMLLVPVVALQLEQAVFRFLVDVREDENKKADVITSVITLIIILGSAASILYFIITRFVLLPYAPYIILDILATMYMSIMLQTARGLGQNIKYSAASCINGFCNALVTMLLLIIFRTNGRGILTAYIVSNIISGTYIFLRLSLPKYIKRKNNNWKTCKELLKYSIPLIPDSISWWIVNALDRTVVTIILGISLNGIYAVANRFSTVYTGIYNVFALSWNESLSLHINDKDCADYVSSVFSNVFELFSALAVLVIAFLPFVFSIFVKDTFYSAYYQVPILILGALFNVLSGFFCAVYFAEKKTVQIAKTSLLGAAVDIAVHLALIYIIGLYAASISTFVAYFLLFVYRYFDTKHYINISLPKFKMLQFGIFYMAITFVYYIKSTTLSIISCILTVCIILFTFRIKVRNIMKNILLKKM